MEKLTIEGVEIYRVLEWVGPLAPVGEMFPDTPAEVWRDNESWLAPTFMTAPDHLYRAAVQTWVLRRGDLTVLVDTGIGNDRHRPQIPSFSNLRTPFLERLAEVGVAPEDVDVVVNTHIHYDHVGWNTRLDGERWVPTFPNARYLVPEPDYTYFHPDNAARMRPPTTEDEKRRFEGIRLVFADSIAPVAEAGQLELWSGAHQPVDGLRLESAPGHTPGSSVLWLGRSAVFVGDLLHVPVQALRTGDSCRFDLDAEQARKSRQRIIDVAARDRATVFPAHFTGPGAVALRTTADGGYAFGDWAALEPV
jgi:glyoxylase-like metal-dependent hydrolase (beta-lactamase superfamily II)